MTGFSGGCQCGAVRYRLSSLPFDASICHCRMCQKAFGGYFAPLADIPTVDLVWTRGTPSVFRSSATVERGFCRDCGTPLTYGVVGRDQISVSIGSLDDPDIVPPTKQYGWESMRPAFSHLPALPEAETTPDYSASSRQHPDHDTESWPPV